MPAPVPVIRRIRVDDCPEGARTHLALESVGDGLARDILLPVIVARGRRPGPVLGLTAALHGNELNGMSVIHRLLQDLDLAELAGAVVAVPVVNVPGYHANKRVFSDGVDLNRIFPGQEGGTQSQVFAARFVDRALSAFTHLIDLHTASTGRINSLYVRADLEHEVSRQMAEAQNPQILLHNRGVEGTLRDCAMDHGIPAITVEVGNPQRVQDDLVWWSVLGIRQVLHELGMLAAPGRRAPPWETIRCGRSRWLYTDRGGFLEVFPHLCDRVRAGDRVAQVRDVYGGVIRDLFAPEAGVVIGKSTNPVNQTGSRVLHLGVEGDPVPAPTAPDE